MSINCPYCNNRIGAGVCQYCYNGQGSGMSQQGVYQPGATPVPPAATEHEKKVIELLERMAASLDELISKFPNKP